MTAILLVLFATNYPEVVRDTYARVNPPPTVAGAFEVTKRVAWALRGDGFGLLLKPGGENIVDWHGKSYSASRICVLATGTTVKVLSDVPTTNGPTWQEEGLPPSDQSCTTALDPEDGTPPLPPSPLDLSKVEAQIAAMAAELHEHVRADGDAHAAIHAKVTEVGENVTAIKDDTNWVVSGVKKTIEWGWKTGAIPAILGYLGIKQVMQ